MQKHNLTCRKTKFYGKTKEGGGLSGAAQGVPARSKFPQALIKFLSAAYSGNTARLPLDNLSIY
jgi:hypothetical protein